VKFPQLLNHWRLYLFEHPDEDLRDKKDTTDAGGAVHSGEQANGMNQAVFDGLDTSTDEVCVHIGSRVSYGTCRNAVLAVNLATTRCASE
jgi:hypothetical protein